MEMFSSAGYVELFFLADHRYLIAVGHDNTYRFGDIKVFAIKPMNASEDIGKRCELHSDSPSRKCWAVCKIPDGMNIILWRLADRQSRFQIPGS